MVCNADHPCATCTGGATDQSSDRSRSDESQAFGGNVEIIKQDLMERCMLSILSQP